MGLRSGKVPGYAGSLDEGIDWLRALPSAALVFEVELDGKPYRATQCRAGVGNGNERFKYARMWESGRFVQHFDFLDLELRDTAGVVLPCQASLDLVAWPDSLTLTARISPGAGTAASKAPAWKNAMCRLTLKGKEIDCRAEKTVEGIWSAGEIQELRINHSVPLRAPNLYRPRMADSKSSPASPGAGGPPPVETNSVESLKIQVSYGRTQNFPVAFDPAKDCYVASVLKLKRIFKTGNTDIRNYDDFVISVENPGAGALEIPFLFELRGPANITGLCPILCDKDGRPTGLPVQLSKNWHHGEYLMAYAIIPAKPGKTEYLLRIVYGFYGTLPSASHAQLSLVGYSNSNGRWDQLAIGCWGETFCFDMDMTCVDNVITDVRGLMFRNGINGAKWSWTDAGWGGDWLGIKDSMGNKFPFCGMRTAYLAHGPCMSEVRHTGFYGAGHEVALDARIRTARSDDYARTFQTLKYTFQSDVPAKDAWLHKMNGSFITPKVAYGNRDGLLAEYVARDDASFPSTGCIPLTGEAPWWVAFPGAMSPEGKDWGTGYRALIIRSYTAVVGGKKVSRPTLALNVGTVRKDGSCLELLLVAPEGVERFRPGDSIEMDLEWISLPRCADDYYGPNEVFRKHLADNPISWKTTYREAVGNELGVRVSGGQLLSCYPVIVKARSSPIKVWIKGGVGCVPIRFEGLEFAADYTLFQIVGGKEVKLDQSHSGNDFWQVDRDALNATCSRTYNLQLDNTMDSIWLLQQVPGGHHGG